MYNCPQCAAPIPPVTKRGGRPRKYCSRACSVVASSGAIKARKAAGIVPPRGACTVDGCEKRDVSKGLCAKHYTRFRNHGDVSHHEFEARREARTKPCKTCGSVFTLKQNTNPTHSKPQAGQFCSRACYAVTRQTFETRSAEREARRRQRQARLEAQGGAKVDRLAIFERDGWECYICLGPTDRTVPKRHPKSPTLDHAIALSRGGKHDPDNLFCAHRGCNQLKNVKPWYDVTVMMR